MTKLLTISRYILLTTLSTILFGCKLFHVHHKVSIAAIDNLDMKIGQMIMIGINDRTSLQENDSLIRELKDGKIGGVLIFEKNIAKTNSFDSLRFLIQNLQKYPTTALFVSIDEEGGRVHRLKEKYGFIPMPSAAHLGQVDNEDSTLYYNENLAAELKKLGINLNYAPCVDMAVNPDNPVIVKNERSFGKEAELVAKHAEKCISAHHNNGVKTILKHFPGHGSSAGDSHLGIVDVTNTWHFTELFPYAKLIESAEVDAIMTAHIINRSWDTSMLPATLSEKTINGILRNLLNYKGVVFSDDMQMQAISDNYGFENSMMLAINAGVDVLMFANTTKKPEKLVTASQMHAAIKKMVMDGKIPVKRIDEAYGRIMALKHKSYH